MKKLVLYLLLLASFQACRNDNRKDESVTSHTVDTLTYRYDSLKIFSKYVVEEKSASATISYPIFEHKTLNDYLRKQVFNFFAEEEKATSYQDIANSFINGYNSYYDSNKGTKEIWFLLINIQVLHQKKNYIALQYLHADYSGGAHPNTNISYINYDLENNQALALDSLINKGKKEELLTIAEQIFRKNEKLTPNASLSDHYFFDKGKFSLAQHFYVSDQGLVFLYNPYEIKPYAAGVTKLVIPFSALKDIARPNTILTKD